MPLSAVARPCRTTEYALSGARRPWAVLALAAVGLFAAAA
jgi:hypothetical protein